MYFWLVILDILTSRKDLKCFPILLVALSQVKSEIPGLLVWIFAPLL